MIFVVTRKKSSVKKLVLYKYAMENVQNFTLLKCRTNFVHFDQ